MTIEPIPHLGGVPRAKVICDECGRDECVPCKYERNNHNKKTHPNESQARAKAMQQGWSYVKNKLRCPTCEAKRKVVPMKPKQSPSEEAPKEPTRAQKRQIMDMLEETYDTSAERYSGGDTDETVAEVLGVMPGWVAKLREEFFGPEGGNEDIESLVERLDDIEKQMKGIEGDCKAMVKDAEYIKANAETALRSNEKKLAEVSTLRADLDKIKKAVGPRVQKAAGV